MCTHFHLRLGIDIYVYSTEAALLLHIRNINEHLLYVKDSTGMWKNKDE